MSVTSRELGVVVRRYVFSHADWVLAAIVFLFSYNVFHRAPIQQANDSRYSMLLSENILRHGDFALERYKLPEKDYRLQWVSGHEYYYFPVGTSILSVPFAAAMDWRHVSAVRADGAYNEQGALALDAKLAALLMAAFAVVAYLSARLVLPVSWSVGVTAISAFGTQAFSTLSRSMWSDTWATLLLGIAALLLLRSSARQSRLNLPLLATLEAWAYVVRPTSFLVLVITAIYIAVTRRKHVWQFLLVVAGWIGLFVLYSWSHFHKVLPDYYAASRLDFVRPAAAFFGNIVSPSRGLIVYVPAVMAIGLLGASYRGALRFRPLALMAVAVVVAHLVMLSGFGHWWGGHCYGARLTAGLAPWIVVLLILVVDAVRTKCASGPRRVTDHAIAVAAGLLCGASVVINTIGAISQETAEWNTRPDNIDTATWRLWDWRRPQFMAPFLEPDGPFPALPSAGLRIGIPDADKYLGRGWGGGEGDFRWTIGTRGSTVHFLSPDPREGTLELELRAYLPAGKLADQRLLVSMNGHELGTITIGVPTFATYSLTVPGDVIRNENALRLRTPDAVSPWEVDRSPDRRVLGVAVRTIRWRVVTRLPTM